MTRKRVIGLIVTILIIAVLAYLDQQVQGPAAGDDYRRYHGQSYVVIRVIDGDTLDLAVADGDQAFTRVRLWGVDTPELARRDGSRPAEPWSEEASTKTRELAEGKRVTLYLEPNRLRGGYGRVLAHVELPDGTLLNRRLIEAGFSESDNRWSHSKIKDFDTAEHRARQAEVGMWSKSVK